MRIAITGLVLAGMLLAGGLAAQSKRQQEIDLQAAIRSETVDGDLKSAIKQYGAIAAKYANDRALTAKALVRMAECHQKLGDAESRGIYERIVRDYADQEEAVTVARTRLGTGKAVVSAKGDRPVWTGPEVDIFGRISADGRYLTYVDWFQTGNLMLHDMLTGKDHALTKKMSWDDSPGQAQYSSISPDGKRVVYEWLNTAGRNELLIADLKGTILGEPKPLVSSEEIRSVRPFEWSPDGKWIAVHLKRTDKTSQIGLVALQDGSVHVLRSVDWRGPNNMCFSSDSAFVAYDLPESDDTRKRDVFVLAVDGSSGRTLVANAADDRLVGMSRDGQLLFASDRAGSMALWAQPFSQGKTHGAPVTVKPDFGKPWIHGLTASGALYVTKRVNDSDVHIAPVDLKAGAVTGPSVGVQRFPSRGRPDWSVDGKFLSYMDCAVFDDGGCTMAIREMESGKVRDLRPKLHHFNYPRWAPDSRSFVTAGRDLKGRQGLYRIDAMSGETTLIAPRYDILSGWSADGQNIFLTRGAKLLQMDVASGKEREVLSLPPGTFNVTLSPDGRLAAFIAKDSTLMVVPSAGGEPRELFRVQAPESLVGTVVLSWTQNSTALVVTKRLTKGALHLGGPRELWLVPVSGGEPRKLDIDANAWNILNSIGAKFSPDGRHVAFLAGRDDMEVWALEGFLPVKKASR